MNTRFLSNNSLWNEIQNRVAKGKRVRAAVAYYGRGGATLLDLKRGDTLVVDLSINAVRQGVTDPREIQKLVRRGVQVFTRGFLHAKFILVDKTLITSSANISNNSKNNLDEAGITTSDPSAVRRAIDFFDQLCTEPVGKHYLKTCIAEYRPPVFKAAVEGGTKPSKKRQRIVEAKLWFVGGLVYLELGEDAQELIAPLERKMAKKLRTPERTEVHWIRYRKVPKFIASIRPGDWVVQCTKAQRGHDVSPPSQVLGLESCLSPRGTQYHMLMLESPTDGERISLARFRKYIAAVQPELNRANPRTRAIEDNDKADRILRLWSSTGKLSKSRR